MIIFSCFNQIERGGKKNNVAKSLFSIKALKLILVSQKSDYNYDIPWGIKLWTRLRFSLIQLREHKHKRELFAGVQHGCV